LLFYQVPLEFPSSSPEIDSPFSKLLKLKLKSTNGKFSIVLKFLIYIALWWKLPLKRQLERTHKCESIFKDRAGVLLKRVSFVVLITTQWRLSYFSIIAFGNKRLRL